MESISIAKRKRVNISTSLSVQIMQNNASISINILYCVRQVTFIGDFVLHGWASPVPWQAMTIVSKTVAFFHVR